MRILVVNAGSSSLKLRVLDEHDAVAGSRDLPSPRGFADERMVTDGIQGFGPVDAVGHRIVHGGTEFSQPVLIDRRVEERLEALVDLAPLHQPKSLAALAAVGAALPAVPAVGCFDTAFHAGMPSAAATYALPPEWRQRWGLRRFGFHGLSHSYASRRAAELLGRPLEGLKLVTCHLGSGASLAAVRDGRSLDTTMGFTPLEGLIMATRSGSVDPGLLLWLLEHAGTPPSEMAAALEHRSGLLALAGTSDMEAVIKAAEAGEPNARLGLDVYIHRLRAGVSAMASAMNGMDALAFTGGVGENAPAVRQMACDGLGFLGVRVDSERNVAARGDADIGIKGASVRTFVITAREDVEIVRGVRQVLGL